MLVFTNDKLFKHQPAQLRRLGIYLKFLIQSQSFELSWPWYDCADSSRGLNEPRHEKTGCLNMQNQRPDQLHS